MQINWSLPIVTMVIGSLLTCGPSQPTVAPTPSEPEPEQTAIPPTVEPARSEPEPEPEQADGCQVELVLEADGDKRLSRPVTLLARAKNLTAKPLELTLNDRCPGGEAQFSGLGDSYDYYRTCMMGACMGGRPPRVIALPPGEIVDIESADIDPSGNASCNGAIAAGSYELTFSLPLAEGARNPTLCGPTPLVLRRK